MHLRSIDQTYHVAEPMRPTHRTNAIEIAKRVPSGRLINGNSANVESIKVNYCELLRLHVFSVEIVVHKYQLNALHAELNLPV